MKFILLALLCITLTQAYKSKLPEAELKLSINLDAIKYIKDYAGPIMETLYINDGEQLDVEFSKTIGWKYFGVNLSVTNVTLSNHTIDWDSIAIVSPETDQISVFLDKISIQVSALTKMSILGIPLTRTIDINLSNLGLDLALEFSKSQNNTESSGLNPKIVYSKLVFDNLDIKLENSYFLNFFLTPVISIAKRFIPGTFNKAIQTFNSTLSEIENMPLQKEFYLNQTMTNYLVGLKFPAGIHVCNNAIHIPLDVNPIKNLNNGIVAPEFKKYNIPDQYVSNQTDIELMVGSSLLQQLLWVGLESDIANAVMNNSTMSEGPLTLTTLGLQMLLPGLAQYGNKGVYLKLGGVSDGNDIAFRQGGINMSFKIDMQFIVDMNDQLYPREDKDVDTCVQGGDCIVAYNMVVTMFTSGQVYTTDKSHLGGSLTNMMISDVVVEKATDLNKDQFIKTINDLVRGMMSTLNQQLSQGVEIPYVEFLPFLDNLDFHFDKGFLIASALIKPPFEKN